MIMLTLNHTLVTTAVGILIGLSGTSTTSAQDAIVADLSPADTARISALYHEQKDVESRIEAENKYVIRTYTKNWPNTYAYYTDGSAAFTGSPQSVFRYSADFRHIVPTVFSAPSSTSVILGGCYNAVQQYPPAGVIIDPVGPVWK